MKRIPLCGELPALSLCLYVSRPVCFMPWRKMVQKRGKCLWSGTCPQRMCYPILALHGRHCVSSASRKKLWWALVFVFCHLPVPRHVNSFSPRNWMTCSCVMFPPSWAPSHEKCCTWSQWNLKLRISRDLPPSSREWTLSRSRQMMRFHVIKTRLWVAILMTFYRPCHQKLSEMVRWFYIGPAHCNSALQLWL